MNKALLLAILSGAISTSTFAVNAGEGTVTFTGSIITAPCSIAPGEENQEIALGQVSNVTLDNGGQSSSQPFQIKLEGCNLQDNKQVSVTFKGTEAGSNTGLLQITGDATGAAVKIMNASGTQVNLNSPVTQNYVLGNNELKFQAALQGTQAKDSDGKAIPVTPGTFQAVTNFTLSYN